MQLRGGQGVPAKHVLARHKRILTREHFWTESELARFSGHPGQLCLEYISSNFTTNEMAPREANVLRPRAHGKTKGVLIKRNFFPYLIIIQKQK